MRFRIVPAFLTVIAGADGASMAGDIEEEYFDRLSQSSQFDVTLWYWSQFFRSLAPLLALRARRLNMVRTFGAIFLGCGIMGLWAATLSAVGLTVVMPLDEAQSPSGLIQSALLAKKALGMVLAGAVIGLFIVPRNGSKIISAPVIAFTIYILAAGIYYSSLGQSALSLPALVIWALSVAPTITAGVIGGVYFRGRTSPAHTSAHRE